MIARCPKCRSGDMFVSEHFSTSSTIHLKAGQVDWTYGSDGQGHSLDRFDALCETCGHRWWMKKSTGSAVLEAASAFDFGENPHD